MSPSPPSRRKSRPKFDLPAETTLSNAPVGWVYRVDEPAAPVIPITSAPAAENPSAGPREIAHPNHHPLLAVGAGMFFVGAGTLGVAAMLTLALVAGPIRLAKSLTGR